MQPGDVMATLIESYKTRYSDSQAEELSLEEYLERCRRDPSIYANPAERWTEALQRSKGWEKQG